jgi:DNA-binding response OmpR family regulator
VAENPGEVKGTDFEFAEGGDKVKLKILVVDDDENIREVLEDLLLLEGHELLLAEDGEQALRIFDENLPDLVITDLGMPGISGWEVARSIKDKDPSKKVIVISGWGATLQKDQLEENFVDQVLAKPFHLEQVKKIIAEVMAKT